MASWDFNPTQPSTPMSARRPSGIEDPFASFSTTNSPYNTLPSRSLSSLPSPSPSSPELTHPSHRDSRSSTSMNPTSSAFRRTRDASRASQTSNHRRNISFDFSTTNSDPSTPPPLSPVNGDATNGLLSSPQARGHARLRDPSLTGSVHFKEGIDEKSHLREEIEVNRDKETVGEGEGEKKEVDEEKGALKLEGM